MATVTCTCEQPRHAHAGLRGGPDQEAAEIPANAQVNPLLAKAALGDIPAMTKIRWNSRGRRIDAI
jgi:hypothetical protein